MDIATIEVRDFAGYVETLAEKARYGETWVRDHIIEQFGAVYLRAQTIAYDATYGETFERCVVNPFTTDEPDVCKLNAFDNIARLMDLIAQMRELEDMFYPHH